MLKDWKQRLVSGWSLMRIIRLGLGIIVIGEAWKSSEILFGLLGGILLAQALLNAGCCGASGCDTNQYPTKIKSSPVITEETTFTKIK